MQWASTDSSASPPQSDTDLSWTALQKIVNADGPPIFLEAALRQLYSLRWKWEQYERQQATRTEAQFHEAAPVSEHQETFKLLFWLAVMFDTISAAMLQRPVVVSDEDSSIAPADPWKPTKSATSSITAVDLDGWGPSSWPQSRRKDHSLDIWGSLFLEKKPPQQEISGSSSFPTAEEAATILCDAAPVKVLLFRKVGHIQKLISRRAGCEVLEAAVEQAVRLCRFWDTTYGRFISQCVANHHELSSRIQSWYVVLAGHWHLGGILLADVIEEMDAVGMSQPSQRLNRQVSGFIQKLRRNNATAISELCRCSLGGDNISSSRTREFSYPVNQVALLSEPWTVVLIQSFSRAGYVFASQLSSLEERRTYTQSIWDDEYSLNKRRCECCIQGLLSLGNKSDMAYLAARYLIGCLQTI